MNKIVIIRNVSMHILLVCVRARVYVCVCVGGGGSGAGGKGGRRAHEKVFLLFSSKTR